MKKESILMRLFKSTSLLVGSLILVIHLVFYFTLPHFYLQQKTQEAKKELTQLFSKINQQDPGVLLGTVQEFAVDKNVNISVGYDDKYYEFLGYRPFDMKNKETTSSEKTLSYEDTSLAHAKDLFKIDGKTYDFQLFVNIQPVREIKKILLKVLPFTFIGSLIFSFLLAFLYSRFLTKPIEKIKDTTKEMNRLKPNLKIPQFQLLELDELGENVNLLYGNLLESITLLKEQVNQLEKVEKEKVQFFQGASHELKTPLTSLYLLMENMELNIPPYNNREKYLGEAKEIVEDLSKQVQQLLFLSKQMEAPKKDVESLDISKILKEKIQQYEIIQVKKDLDVNITIEESIFLKISEEDLRQVLSVLIENSYFYTPKKGKIAISLEKGKFEIRNTGRPLPKEEFEQLFQPFYRPFGQEEIHEGSGLGLYLASQILKKNEIDYHFSYENGEYIFQCFF